VAQDAPVAGTGQDRENPEQYQRGTDVADETPVERFRLYGTGVQERQNGQPVGDPVFRHAVFPLSDGQGFQFYDSKDYA
jgi:hypothetical protein